MWASALLAPFSPQEWTAIFLSLKVATIGMFVSLPFGVAIAFLLARRDFPGKGVLNGIVHLPLVLPPVVTGWLLLLGFGRQGPLGAVFADCCGLVFSFRWTGAALAAGVMGFPLMVRAIRLSLEAVDVRLEQAAETLGARPVLVFATITLPLAAPSLFGGALMTWARALGEFGATIMFAGNFQGITQTMPLAIYIGLETNLDSALALSVILIIVSFGILAAVRFISPKGFTVG